MAALLPVHPDDCGKINARRRGLSLPALGFLVTVAQTPASAIASASVSMVLSFRPAMFIRLSPTM
jgi:hypothetical protein